MNTALLGGIIFVLVFAGIILLHEFGHFIVARLLKIEVEEFAIGFPPRLLRLWRGKGSILIGKERLVLPINFDLPFDPKVSLHRPVNAVATSDPWKTCFAIHRICSHRGRRCTARSGFEI